MSGFSNRSGALIPMLRRSAPALLALAATLIGCESLFLRPAPPPLVATPQDASDAYLAFERGDCEAALELSDPEALEDWAASEARFSMLLLHGFCLEMGGDREEARELYGRIAESAEGYFAARDARERLRILRIQDNDPEYTERVNRARDRARNSRGQSRVPVRRDPASFPPIPHQVGIEGFAVVEFGVTPQGTTTDVLVVDSKPRLLFDGSATRAVRRWEYLGKPEARRADRQVVRLLFQPRAATPAAPNGLEPATDAPPSPAP